jgi:hypothetical protein
MFDPFDLMQYWTIQDESDDIYVYLISQSNLNFEEYY